MFRSYLKTQSEPSHDNPLDMQIVWARMKVAKVRARGLSELREMIAPDQSYEIDVELASELFRYRTLAWMCFRINDLPTEILCEILRLVVYSTSQRNPMLAKFQFTWVCRHWRATALSDGYLWSQIIFTDRPPWARSIECFRRAENWALDIIIPLPPKSPGNPAEPAAITPARMTWLLDILLQKIATLQRVTISTDSIKTALSVIERFWTHGSAPTLEHFELHRFGQPHMFELPPEIETTFDGALPLCKGQTPRLKNIRLNGIPVNWEETTWSGDLYALDLRRFWIANCPSEARFRQMLSGGNLRSLHLTAAMPQYDEGSLGMWRDTQPIFLPRLREIVFGDLSVPYARKTFAVIHAPNLRMLALQLMDGDDYSPVFGMLAGRFPELRILALHEVGILRAPAAYKKWALFLQSIPKVFSLKVGRLDSAMVDTLVLKAETYIVDSDADLDPNRQPLPPLLPALQCVEFVGVRCSDVRNFVTWRRDQVHTPIAKAYVLAPPPEDPLTPEFVGELSPQVGLIIDPNIIQAEEADLRARALLG